MNPVGNLTARAKSDLWEDHKPTMDVCEVDKEVHTLKGNKRKLRWVARGSQQWNVDINKLFAAVVNKDTLRAVLAILNYIDVKSTQLISSRPF